MNRLLSCSLLLLLTMLLANCSGNFNQEWAEARTSQQEGITGAWLGTWRSEVNGHHGELRCVVSSEDHKSDSYRFHYHAIYGNLLTAAYVVTEQVERRGNQFKIHGEHNLGYLAGGLYHYEGTATVSEMHSTYGSPADHGFFELKRP